MRARVKCDGEAEIPQGAGEIKRLCLIEMKQRLSLRRPFKFNGGIFATEVIITWWGEGGMAGIKGLILPVCHFQSEAYL